MNKTISLFLFFFLLTNSPVYALYDLAMGDWEGEGVINANGKNFQLTGAFGIFAAKDEVEWKFFSLIAQGKEWKQFTHMHWVHMPTPTDIEIFEELNTEKVGSGKCKETLNIGLVCSYAINKPDTTIWESTIFKFDGGVIKNGYSRISSNFYTWSFILNPKKHKK